MTEGVKLFLKDLGMTRYYDLFMAKGFDSESDIPHLTSFDLQEELMITSQQDRTLILSNACTFRPSSQHLVHEWLRSNSLEYYFISFVQSELTDLAKIAELKLPDENLYDELEIVLPGHRKRLERAVARLRQEMTKDITVECPVTFGWWGKPECLPQAKFDFLCVKAHLYAAQEPSRKICIDFMVDSGSDVSTVQEDTLKELNLELIGPVYSCGIHGGNHTNLYRARLRVGDQEMDIEVMGSNYDSLGSRVVRHFRHVIDGKRHIWLKGDQSPHVPAITSALIPEAIGHSGFQVLASTNPGSSNRSLPPAAVENSLDTHQNTSVKRVTKVAEEMPDIEMHEEYSELGQNQPAVTQAARAGPSNQTGMNPCLPNSEGIPKASSSGTGRSQGSLINSGFQPCKIQTFQDTSSGTNVSQNSNGRDSHRNHGKSRSPNSRKSVKRKHSPSPETPVKSSGCAEPEPREGKSDCVSNTGAGADDMGAPGSTHTSSAASEIVSLCNLIPPHLRDTDDDIDYMGDTSKETTSPAIHSKSSQPSTYNSTSFVTFNHLYSLPVDEVKLSVVSSDQHSNNSYLKTRSIENTRSVNSCSETDHLNTPCAIHTSASSQILHYCSSVPFSNSNASSFVLSTPTSTQIDQIFTTYCHEDVVHVGGTLDSEESETEEVDADPTDMKNNLCNNHGISSNDSVSKAVKLRRMKVTQNFVQADSGVMLIPLDLLETTTQTSNVLERGEAEGEEQFL